MNFKRLAALWVLIALLVCTACQHQPVVKPVEAQATQAAAEPTGNPPGLDSAVKLAWDWWELHKAGFLNFHVSPPERKWELDGSYSKMTIFRSTRLDKEGVWFATTYPNRPRFWEITMPTQAESDIIFSISVNEQGEARFTGINHFYPIPGLFAPPL